MSGNVPSVWTTPNTVGSGSQTQEHTFHSSVLIYLFLDNYLILLYAISLSLLAVHFFCQVSLSV
jgi:hypothetical protein